MNKNVDEMYEIHVKGTRIQATAEHPFWVKDKGWVKVIDLHIGDQLEDEKVKITSHR